MDTETTAVPTALHRAMVSEETRSRYDDDLVLAGLVADHASRTDIFVEEQAAQTDNTHTAHRDALKCFSTYLAAVRIQRAADDLYQAAPRLRGLSAGHLRGFRTWLLEPGGALGILNQRLSIIRRYCCLAHAAGTIPDDVLEMNLAMKGYGGK